jgi:hypothetical protein
MYMYEYAFFVVKVVFRVSAKDVFSRAPKMDTTSKGSLLSRMTRFGDNGSRSEQGNDCSTSIFGQANGT